MVKPTKQTQVCDKLSELGYKEVKSKSAKYRTFDRTNGEFYFVGRNGSLRTGKHISDSFSVSYKVPALLRQSPRRNHSNDQKTN